MDGLARSVGNGISGIVATAFGTIENVVRSMVASANALVPGGYLPVVIFVVLVLLAWFLAKR